MDKGVDLMFESYNKENSNVEKGLKILNFIVIKLIKQNIIVVIP